MTKDQAELLISYLLLIGLLVSLTVLIGGAFYLMMHGHEIVPKKLFIMNRKVSPQF